MKPGKAILILLAAVTTFLASVPAAAQSQGPPAIFGASAGGFIFLNGAMGDDSTFLPALTADMEYRINDEWAAGLAVMTLIHPAIEWHVNGIIPFPMLSVQQGDPGVMSQRIDFGPPMWGQSYLLAGYSIIFQRIVGSGHVYWDYDRGFLAVALSAGYQLSF